MSFRNSRILVCVLLWACVPVLGQHDDYVYGELLGLADLRLERAHLLVDPRYLLLDRGRSHVGAGRASVRRCGGHGAAGSLWYYGSRPQLWISVLASTILEGTGMG